MKQTVSVPQPYAEALCTRVCDVVHLEVAPHQLPCRYIVVSTEPVYNPSTPLEWVMAIHNHQVFGNIGATDTLPVNVPIGFVDVVEQVPHDYNIWTLGLPEPVFRVRNARMFDKPSLLLPFRKDQPLHKWLPSYRFNPAKPSVGQNHISFHVNPQLFSLAEKHGSFTVDLTEDFNEIKINDDGMLDVLRDVYLYCGKREMIFINGASEIFFELNDDGDLVTYPSLLNHGQSIPRRSLLISCNHPSIELPWLNFDTSKR